MITAALFGLLTPVALLGFGFGICVGARGVVGDDGDSLTDLTDLTGEATA